MSCPAGMDDPTRGVAHRSRRTIVLAVKITATVLLIGLAFGLADLSTLVGYFRGADLALLGLVLLLMLGNTVLEAIQFAEVVRALGRKVTIGASLEMSLAGRFFGTISPASIGSDVYRAFSMRLFGMPTSEAVKLVLASRLMAFLALVPVLAAGVPFALVYVDAAQERAMLLAGPVLVLASLATLVSSGRLAGSLPGRWPQGLRSALDALLTVAARSPLTPYIWMAALGQHLVRVVIFAVISDALGIEVPLDALFAFVPVSLLVAMIPVTLGSWGLRELSLVYTLGLSGVDTDAALAISITFGGSGLAFGVLCGVFWLSKPVRL